MTWYDTSPWPVALEVVYFLPQAKMLIRSCTVELLSGSLPTFWLGVLICKGSASNDKIERGRGDEVAIVQLMVLNCNKWCNAGVGWLTCGDISCCIGSMALSQPLSRESPFLRDEEDKNGDGELILWWQWQCRQTSKRWWIQWRHTFWKMIRQTIMFSQIQRPL